MAKKKPARKRAQPKRTAQVEDPRALIEVERLRHDLGHIRATLQENLRTMQVFEARLERVERVFVRQVIEMLGPADAATGDPLRDLRAFLARKPGDR